MTVYAVLGGVVALLLVLGIVALSARRRVAKEMSVWRRTSTSRDTPALPARAESEPEAEAEAVDPSQFVAADPVARMVEAIACWHVRLGDARETLVDAAVGLLVAGDEHPAVIELASLYPQEDSFTIDTLVERVVGELGLEDGLATAPDAIVTRRIGRGVLSGALKPRELARWAHSRFHHESDSDLINELAGLDDEYDLVDEGWIRIPVSALDARVREIAALLVRGA